MQLSYNTELLLPNMGIFRKCFKAVMGMAVGPNHHLMAVFPHGQGLRLYLFLTKAVLYSFIILGTLNQWIVQEVVMSETLKHVNLRSFST